MPKELYAGLFRNPGIRGTIPAEFVNNNGTYFDLFRTNVRGCVPGNLKGFFRTIAGTQPDGTEDLRDLLRC
jgi:hypothetical protein